MVPSEPQMGGVGGGWRVYCGRESCRGPDESRRLRAISPPDGNRATNDGVRVSKSCDGAASDDRHGTELASVHSDVHRGARRGASAALSASTMGLVARVAPSGSVVMSR